ncbi:Monofunctional biosynthetic peptidoglycan transglycosylase [Quillaja saponaria]|uniref:Monofunctional biosynthetic peptidoglycan transglycosylase n=1 Tax=Quillaja saponaria TaxID=32244 RepID=A0AAD7PFL9_QUISA|nr:Monofunctional biosynthetic peptidoglycan transglycosylase [Quillaja saponaria]
MEANSLTSKPPALISLTKPSIPTTSQNQVFLWHRQRFHGISTISCTSSSSDSSNTSSNSAPPPTVQPPKVSPETVGVRFRRRSRRRSKQQKEDGAAASSSAKTSNPTPKKWEDMNFTEKAIELYMGEKGALFWLNKFAYASIFITIGAWILFRFVGPSLNLYQLDTPPLSPSNMFKEPS